MIQDIRFSRGGTPEGMAGEAAGIWDGTTWFVTYSAPGEMPLTKRQSASDTEYLPVVGPGTPFPFGIPLAAAWRLYRASLDIQTSITISRSDAGTLTTGYRLRPTSLQSFILERSRSFFSDDYTLNVSPLLPEKFIGLTNTGFGAISGHGVSLFEETSDPPEVFSPLNSFGDPMAEFLGADGTFFSCGSTVVFILSAFSSAFYYDGKVWPQVEFRTTASHGFYDSGYTTNVELPPPEPYSFTDPFYGPMSGDAFAAEQTFLIGSVSVTGVLPDDLAIPIYSKVPLDYTGYTDKVVAASGSIAVDKFLECRYPDPSNPGETLPFWDIDTGLPV